MEKTETLPLFPLGLVLFPGMLLPLHIFEERYKLMIAECLEQKKNFGIVYYNGEKFCNIGCSARVNRVIQKYDDGRMDILTEGMQRFQVENTSSLRPYLEAEVKYFDDQYETDFDGMEALIEQGTDLLREIMKLASEEIEVPKLNQLDPKVLSFLIASVSGFSLEEKQFFLELINTRERMEKSVKSLQKITERLIMTKDIEKIIQGNGYLPHKG
jgi:Lon protease-like protein